MTLRLRRPSGPLLFSIVTHVALGVVIMNAAFHYDFIPLGGERHESPVQENIRYVTVAPAGGAMGAVPAAAPGRATQPSRGLVAPSRVPTVIAPAAPATAGIPGGVTGGAGAGGGIGPTTGIVPGDPDPRLSSEPRIFQPAPKSHAQRVDSAVKATILAYSDSVARAAANAGRQPGDWTFGKDGKKWGIDGNKIYLGKFAIPSAVLAALPIKIQGNPGESIANRLSSSHRSDIQVHAASQAHDAEFKTAVKRIRERKERERRERLAANAGQ